MPGSRPSPPIPAPPAPHADALRRLDEGLVRALHALLSEVSVARAAARLGLAQPAMSRQLRALRQLTGDELLVRIGNRMALTARAEGLLAPCRRILSDMALLTEGRDHFGPAEAEHHFRLAAYDILPATFFAALAQRVGAGSPRSVLTIRSMGEDAEYIRQLSEGAFDCAITTRQQLPGHFHATNLLSDPVVCVVRQDHPFTRRLDAAAYRAARHVSSLEQAEGQGGAMDALLLPLGIVPQAVVRTQYFGLIPAMLMETDLVLTTGRAYGQAMARTYPLAVVPFPLPIAPLRFHMVWHERTHRDKAAAWFRGEIVAACRATLGPGP